MTASRLRTAGQALLRIVVPPLCHACGRLLDCEDVLCADCRADLEPLSGAVCLRCGRPFASAAGPEHTCSSCLERRPQMDLARAAFKYQGVLARMIQVVKFERRYPTVRALVALVPRPEGELDPALYDVAASVPMTNGRLRRRLANPGHMIARRLAARWGIRYDPRLLRRLREGPPQSSLPAAQRWNNVRNAFSADPRQVNGRAVLLLDDLITTGATADACAKALKAAGALTVGVYAVARTVEHEPVSS